MRLVFDRLTDRLPAFARIASPIAWTLIWISAIGFVALVHLAFFDAWPDNFVHEDSVQYLGEAQSILTGHYVDQPGYRPYGVAFFLALLSKLFSPNILVFVTAQHVMSVMSALFIATAVRFSGAPRVFSLLSFLLAALYARTIHYDNTIGEETTSVFLTSLAVFIASGAAFKKWPPLGSAAGVGLILGAAMVCRSAAIGASAIILIWLAATIDVRGIRRLALLTLAGGTAAAIYLVPTAVNLLIGMHPAGDEDLSVMSFVVGYSADFDRGVHLGRKSQVRQFVNEKRAAEGPLGWADINEYQWPLEAVARMRKPNESRAELEKAVRDIFIETLTTPSTLWNHLSKRFIREMYFLLFDGNYPASRASNPRDYEFFVKRDAFPFFHSPTGLKSRRLIYDHYSPPKALSWLLPSADKLQAVLDTIFSLGYAPRYDPAPLCCGLTISSEYDWKPGPIRWLSASTLALLAVLLTSEAARLLGGVPPLPRSLVAGGMLMILLALVNAALPAFFVYGFNRYAYYVTPFMAGAIGILGTVLVEQTRLIVESWRKVNQLRRSSAKVEHDFVRQPNLPS